MSVFRGGDIEIPKGNFAEYIFSKLREHPEHILLVWNWITHKLSHI